MAAKVAVITAMLSIPFVLSCLSHPTRRRGRRRRKARKGPEAIKLHIKIAKLQEKSCACFFVRFGEIKAPCRGQCGAGGDWGEIGEWQKEFILI